MIIYVENKYKRTSFFVGEDVLKNNSVIIIMKLLVERNFDYYRNTFIPSQEEKKYLIELYEEEITKKLLLRNQEEFDYYKSLGERIKEVIWKESKINLLVSEFILKDMINIFNFLKVCYDENIDIYFDYFDKSGELYKYSDNLSPIEITLFNNIQLNLKDFIRKNKIPSEDIMYLINLLEDTGCIKYIEKNIIVLTERGERVLNKSQKQNIV